MKGAGADRVHAALMLLAACLTALYWLIYFTSGATQARSDAIYLGFENSFPLADSWMALALVISACCLLRGDSRAVPWGICAGSAMVYLASMDLSFDLEQKVFGTAMNGKSVIEAAINLSCWILGPLTIVRFWRHPLRQV
jgi:hypothetical protein